MKEGNLSKGKKLISFENFDTSILFAFSTQNTPTGSSHECDSNHAKLIEQRLPPARGNQTNHYYVNPAPSTSSAAAAAPIHPVANVVFGNVGKRNPAIEHTLALSKLTGNEPDCQEKLQELKKSAGSGRKLKNIKEDLKQKQRKDLNTKSKSKKGKIDQPR